MKRPQKVTREDRLSQYARKMYEKEKNRETMGRRTPGRQEKERKENQDHPEPPPPS